VKTAVLGEAEPQHIVYNPKLVSLAQHYGFTPRARRAYRAQTKGKVERPCRYIRQDFFLGRRFRNLEDLNAQLRHLLDALTSVRGVGVVKNPLRCVRKTLVIIHLLIVIGTPTCDTSVTVT
jgi:hypothetical protein